MALLAENKYRKQKDTQMSTFHHKNDAYIYEHTIFCIAMLFLWQFHIFYPQFLTIMHLTFYYFH